MLIVSCIFNNNYYNRVINQSNNIDFKLKSHHPIEEKYPETLSASSKMLLSLKINDQIVKTYDKLRNKWNKTNTSTTMTTIPQLPK